MTQEEAFNHVQQFTFAVQRIRSILIESYEKRILDDKSIDEIGESMLAYLHPWLFGQKCILIGLQKISNQQQLTPSDFYNLMWVANIINQKGMLMDWTPPTPDISWIKGWDNYNQEKKEYQFNGSL